MDLPPTYYDFMRKLRPGLVEMAEQDAEDLLSGPNPPQTIHSVDDYNSRFQRFIERLNAKLLGYGDDHPGVSVEEMSPYLSSAPPQTKASFASLYGTVSNEYHSVVNFVLAGKKTFHFSDNLAEHLANTEINLKAALIQLPFPTCLFTLTSRAIVNAMHNIRGDAGRWAMNVGGLDYDAPVSAFLTMHPASGGLPGRKLLICAWHARLPHTSYLALKRELYLGDQWTLEQALHTDWETLTPNDLGIGTSVSLDDDTIAHQDDDTFYRGRPNTRDTSRHLNLSNVHHRLEGEIRETRTTLGLADPPLKRTHLILDLRMEADDSIVVRKHSSVCIATVREKTGDCPVWILRRSSFCNLSDQLITADSIGPLGNQGNDLVDIQLCPV